MHELGITQSILATAVEAATEQGATHINDVTVSVGELTEIMEFALLFHWDIATQETLAEGSSLTVHMVSPRSKCGECGHEYDHDKYDFTCPECGNFVVETLAGRELRIDNIDVDMPDGEGPPEPPGPDE